MVHMAQLAMREMPHMVAARSHPRPRVEHHGTTPYVNKGKPGRLRQSHGRQHACVEKHMQWRNARNATGVGQQRQPFDQGRQHFRGVIFIRTACARQV
jgi:hypothetical protein